MMKVQNLMITENDVIESVSKELVEKGYEIINTCNTTQKGIDIRAVCGQREIMIEAKGGTTSKDTNRKGKPFNSNQIKNHVAVAVFKVMQLKQENEGVTVAIALPGDMKHKKVVNSIQSCLDMLDIKIIWSDGEKVTIEKCRE